MSTVSPFIFLQAQSVGVVQRVLTAAALCLCVAFTAAAQNTAGIVIQNSSNEIITRCVEFGEDEITVDELLERSGFRRVISETGFGKALCFLHDDGIADAANCFGHPLGFFWELFQHDGTDWVSSETGISETVVRDGSLVGFAFGAFGENRLPPMTFDEVCGFTGTAGVVVDHSDGRRTLVQVDFLGETITGTQLLQKSGLLLALSETSFGTALCALNGEGQPAGDCFGDPLGRFWGFNVLNEKDEWVFSPEGIDEAVIREGDVVGFIFAEFGVEQPSITREDVFAVTSNVEDWEPYR